VGRIINPETAGKERIQFQRATLLALRELMKQSAQDSTTYDLAAFVVLALEAIDQTIDPSITAWEKRGYWLKADRFRMEWSWAGRFGQQMRNALLSDDWTKVALVAGQVATKLDGIKVPVRHRLGTPWVGAWEKLSKRPK
jgi:hypothetical protein